MLKFFKIVKWYFLSKLSVKFFEAKVLDNKMLLDRQTDGISRALFLNGERELDMVQIVRELCKGSNAILDLGANIGYYTLLMERESADCFILAIEPDIRNFRLLELNVASYCQKGKVFCLNVAAGKNDGFAKMAVAEKSNLNTLVALDSQQDEETIEVEVNSFTSLINYFPEKKFDFLRMDIEGFEYEIFQALLDNLDDLEFKPKILFESHSPLYSEDNRNMGDILYKFCDKYNYAVSKIVSSGEGATYFNKHNLSVSQEIKSDGFVRNFYDDPPIDLVCDSLMQKNKVVRYVLVEPREIF